LESGSLFFVEAALALGIPPVLVQTD